jgi:hydroxymethylpyrimidine pyrophosphatase-like HAD family hydrolase
MNVPQQFDQEMPILLDRLPNPNAVRSQIRAIVTDVDGTLTRRGQFTAELLRSLDRLATAGIPVWISTGRSAGWVSALVTYLPVAGAIAENGGLVFLPPGSPLLHSKAPGPGSPASGSPVSGSRPADARPADARPADSSPSPDRPGSSDADPLLSGAGIPLSNIADLRQHRAALAATFAALQAEFPHLRESDDNAFRQTDWTFDVAGLGAAELARMGDRCAADGWEFTYSTVQCHIKPPHQDKANGLCAAQARFFPEIPGDCLLTVGDSPNDAPMFDPARFPHSVGVANVLHYQGAIAHLPAYVTHQSESAGFAELVDWLLQT